MFSRIAFPLLCSFAVATPHDGISSMGPASYRCGAGLMVCEVVDPTRLQKPWAGSTNPYPQCYDPTLYTCSSNFLCPIDAPKIAGQYACGPINKAIQLPPSSSQQISITINAPGTGDIDGIRGLNFIIDATLQATSVAYNSDIPFKPLYQDSKSSTFGPGHNAAFPGLVVLQNTTVNKAPLFGPNTNLAGLFQLNGVAKSGTLNQYNTIWDAGAAAFGIGPSEITMYYVNGTAGKTMPVNPEPSDGLISNVATVAFTISNRTAAVPSTAPHCVNGATYTPLRSMTGPYMAPFSIEIIHPLQGDVVGVNGSGWILDLQLDADSAQANSFITPQTGYESGFVNQSSPFFKPGPDSLLPGLVVLLSTTVNTGAFKGPGTNLAGLFQINNLRTVDCNTTVEIWAEWLVGKPIAGHGASRIYAFLVNGTAPAVVQDPSNPAQGLNLISRIASVDIVLS